MKHSVSKKLSIILGLSLMNSTHANQPIILWDIHDVLLTRSGIVSTLWNYENWWKLITHTNFWLLKDLISLGVQNLFTAISSEEYIHLTQKHHNPYLKELAIQLTNSQQPIPGMYNLINELHKAGYSQHIASNIGKTSFLALTNPKQSPHLAPLFAHIDKQKSHVVSYENNKTIKKPDPTFLKTYLKKNNIDLKKTPVIFIDNDPNNITSARQVGLDTILYDNPEQLRIELQKRKIAIPRIDHDYKPIPT